MQAIITEELGKTYPGGKEAVRGLTLSLDQATLGQAGSDIRVCTVLPGPIDTPMFVRAENMAGFDIRAIPPAFSPERVAFAESVLDRLSLPPGFSVNVFARDLGGVRVLAAAPDGTVYASVPSAGRILRLRDADPAVIDVYAQHGRIRGGSLITPAQNRGWCGDEEKGAERGASPRFPRNRHPCCSRTR